MKVTEKTRNNEDLQYTDGIKHKRETNKEKNKVANDTTQISEKLDKNLQETTPLFGVHNFVFYRNLKQELKTQTQTIWD